ncbi:hypothetical protein C8J57DRAFT_1218552 [Mycena rebaudengoi]|nr:hypothetical protein C8J57DRAFT_1218552 [Mycena rebaudengoi]
MTNTTFCEPLPANTLRQQILYVDKSRSCRGLRENEKATAHLHRLRLLIAQLEVLEPMRPPPPTYGDDEDPDPYAEQTAAVATAGGAYNITKQWATTVHQRRVLVRLASTTPKETTPESPTIMPNRWPLSADGVVAPVGFQFYQLGHSIYIAKMGSEEPMLYVGPVLQTTNGVDGVHVTVGRSLI